jgi:hypothetical protein
MERAVAGFVIKGLDGAAIGFGGLLPAMGSNEKCNLSIIFPDAVSKNERHA